MNHALRRVSLACLAMFLLLLVNANYVQGFEAGKLAGYPGNGRTFAQQYQYQRGSIISSDNVPIAASKHVPGIYSFQRYYPEGATYAPVTGYDTPYSKTGIEQAELTVSCTVAPLRAFPVTRSMRLRTASRGSVPASSLSSACSMPVLPYGVS